MKHREILYQVSCIPSGTLLVLINVPCSSSPTIDFGEVLFICSSLMLYFFSSYFYGLFFFVFSFQKFNYDLAQHGFLSAYPVWALIIFLSLDIYVFCQILGEGSSVVLSNTLQFHALFFFLNVGLY